MNRRSFITGAATLFCAPAIVRASSLMPVRSRPFYLEEFPLSPDEVVRDLFLRALQDMRAIPYTDAPFRIDGKLLGEWIS